MDSITAIRHFGVCSLEHSRRHSTFMVASQRQVGCYVHVRRLDEAQRPVSAGDIHAIAYADMRPGESLRLRLHSSKPASMFMLTMMPPPPAIILRKPSIV